MKLSCNINVRNQLTWTRSLTYKERVASVHNTTYGHCNLQNTTAVAADDLSPGNDTDMLLFLLHLYYEILSTGDDALRKFWPITFDEDTYTRYVYLLVHAMFTTPLTYVLFIHHQGTQNYLLRV